MRSGRVIFDFAGDANGSALATALPGAWNMAVDDALLGAAAEGRATTIRFYGWPEATLSLGYFQRHADRSLHPPSGFCPIVRRASGGGAIVHDRELTYSLALSMEEASGSPLPSPALPRGESLYAAVHETLLLALAALGAGGARLWGGDSRSSASPGEAPFLCFERRTAADVVLNQWKIAGSAQRRRGGAVLQHGSILLDRSPAAPTLPGVNDVAGTRISPEVLAQAWLPILAERLGIDARPAQLDEVDRLAAEAAYQQTFAAPTWLQRR